MSDDKDRTRLLERVRRIATSTWSDAIDHVGQGRVASGMTWRCGDERLAGFARTIREEVGALGRYPVSDFALPRILDGAEPGDALVFQMEGEVASTFGGIAARWARANGIAGLIVDGACRDIEEIRATGLSVTSRLVTPTSGKTRLRVSEVNGTVLCGGVTVNPGDLVVADETGVAFVPAASLDEVLKVAEELSGQDKAYEHAVDSGASFAATLASGYQPTS